MSVIIKEPKSIFIHVPKTAGSSISNWLESYVCNAKDDYIHADASYYNKPDHFTFACVRNPYDRVVSAYFFAMKHYKLKCSFLVFLKSGPKSPIKTKNWEPMKVKVYWRSQSILVEGCDLIMRYENLEEDFVQIQDFYNVYVPLPIINTTEHKHYSHYYDEECYDIVTEMFETDLKEFGYKYEGII
jgi:hypothetical protein